MNPALKDKNVVIGVTGGIACYKVLDLIKELRRLKANVYIYNPDKKCIESY